MDEQLLAIRPAVPEDSAEIADVLRAAKLPAEAIGPHIDGFLVARTGSDMVGCVALEQYGATGVLRSLAVTPDFRGKTLGVMLAEAIIERAKENHLHSVVLLTETAEDFFGRKLGFRVVERDAVDQAARESWQFTGAVCQSATCMMRELR